MSKKGLMLYNDKAGADNEEGFSCKGCLNYNLERGWEVDETFTCGDALGTLIETCMTCKEKAVQGRY